MCLLFDLLVGTTDPRHVPSFSMIVLSISVAHSMQGLIVLLVLVVLFTVYSKTVALLLIHVSYMLHVHNSLVLRIDTFALQDAVQLLSGIL
jgi:hypothetical protein